MKGRGACHSCWNSSAVCGEGRGLILLFVGLLRGNSAGALCSC